MNKIFILQSETTEKKMLKVYFNLLQSSIAFLRNKTQDCFLEQKCMKLHLSLQHKKKNTAFTDTFCSKK